MDLVMGPVDGLAGIGMIRETCPASCRILAVTQLDDPGYLKDAIRAGAAGYLLKRSSTEELVRAVRKVATGAIYVDAWFDVATVSRILSAGVGQCDEPLSPREEHVLKRIAWGYSNKEVADSLGISIKTVESYKAAGLKKERLRTRAELVRYAVRRGWFRDLPACPPAPDVH